ncbi:MAG: transglycosylase SLT domain-containing protein [Bacteroidetes bacterium]|nr:transglycosylase SLT domain-containing protein [Bacteroidota bacterium]
MHNNNNLPYITTTYKDVVATKQTGSIPFLSLLFQRCIKTIFRRNNPEHAIRSQSAYLKWLYNRFKYLSEEAQLTAVLAAYNWGIGNVKKMINRLGWLDLSSTPDETQKYVKRIERFMSTYKAMS